MRMALSSPISRPVVSRPPNVVVLGGAIAGVGGGLAMAITGFLIAAVLGLDSWLGPKEIAALVYGPAAITQPGFVVGPVVAGIVLHVLVAGALGAMFEIVYHRILHLTTAFGLPVYAGLIAGIWLWVANYFVVLPVLNPGLTETSAAAFLVQHLLYGTVTGLLDIRLRPTPYHES